MKNYIVKIREYDDSGLLSYGTGIVIGNGTAILTAAHVICGSKHCVIVVSEKEKLKSRHNSYKRIKWQQYYLRIAHYIVNLQIFFQIRKFLTTIYRGQLKDILPMNNLPMR